MVTGGRKKNQNMSEGAPFRINSYMSRKIFEVILFSLCCIFIEDVEYNDGLFYMV